MISVFLFIPTNMNMSLTTNSNTTELYLIVTGKLSGALYHMMPSHTAYLLKGTQKDAARTFALLAARAEDMTVRQYITENYIEGLVEEDEIYQEDEEPRKATDEEIEKYILEMTISNLSENYIEGYEKFDLDRWAEIEIPIYPLPDDIEFKYD